MDIDALEGWELSKAVAKALQWPEYSDMDYLVAVNVNDPLPDRLIAGKYPMIKLDGVRDHVSYDPHQNVHLAFLLDRSLSVQINVRPYKYVTVDFYQEYPQTGNPFIHSTLPYSVPVDKAIATGICRCWLKMMEELKRCERQIP